MKTYINGVLADTAPVSNITTNTQVWEIGRQNNATHGYWWKGQIDEARIYNRALSATDIETLYAFTPTPDTEAPTAPTSLTATSTSVSQINLSWATSTDNQGVAGYQVFRGTTQVATTTTTAYSDSGLTASTTYSYTVKAFDSAGNVSASSNTATATTQSSTLTQGLKAFYPANTGDVSGTTVYDRSGNTNNGVLTNGATTTTGKLGQGLSFDGTNDYVNVSNSTSLNVGNALTVAAWVYNTDTGTTNYHGIVSKSNASSASSGWWFNVEPAGQLVLTFADYDHYGNNPVPKNQWVHVAATYDGTTVKFYINGQLDQSNTSNRTITNDSGSLKLGDQASWYGHQYWKGKLDEARVYNRALSATEIQELYTAQ